ncbi:hypothetical protein EVAR_53638_1 [Eumeta japonica]|uniref:Uncharacterized protein n=1 Tax=Eumeta variegata TaxID=151549 RepID=A0A4C1YMP9_EUMVA|nr:hypothetical protein EVAR_53638_1 [Eumeta japonica]
MWPKSAYEACRSRTPAIEMVLMIFLTIATMTEIRDKNYVEYIFLLLPMVHAIEHAHKCYMHPQGQRPDSAKGYGVVDYWRCSSSDAV